MLERIRKPVEKDFENFLLKLSDAFKSSHENGLLAEISDYLNISSGKALRPTLILLTSKMFGADMNQAISVATSLELLHISSLLHDDVVDESKQRRNHPSINAQWGNKTAILAGDYFLSKALYYSSLTNNIHIINELARIGNMLAEGELQQLFHSKTFSADEKVYYHIIEHKTAGFFSLATSVGPILTGENSEVVEQMRQFGHYLGMIFQIKDDIFDYCSDNHVGKPVGNDLLEGKLTLPLIHSLQTASAEEKRSLPNLSFEEITPEKVSALYQFAIQRGGIQYAESVMSDLKEKAVHCLDGIQDSDIKHSLLLSLEFVISREK